MPLTRKNSPRIRKSAHLFKLAIFLIAVILVQSSVLAKNNQRSGMLPGLGKSVPIGAVPHTIGNLWCNLTNYGWLGDADMATPSMEWPGGTGNMYLYQGSLWVAGVNATGSHCTAGDEEEWYPQLSQSKIDTFSSINGTPFTTDDYVIVLASSNLSANIDPDYVAWYDSDLYGVKDFDDDGDGLVDEDPLDYIDNDGDGLINEDFAAVSEEDTYTMYNDLWLDMHQSGDEGLGLEIIERTYAWSYSYAEDFFILDYEVINIGRALLTQDSDNPLLVEPDDFNDITDVYLAIRYDFDISNRASGEYWYDDLTEYLASDKLSYGYDADDPDVAGNDKGENGLSPGYLGIRTLDTSIPDLNGNKGIPSSHNWWTIDDDPSSDALKFQYMSNGVYAAVPPTPYDYRYLHTVGPFDLAAGDTVRWYVATGIGMGLGGRDNPDPHNEKGSLRDVMAFSQELYDAGWLAATPPPAPKLEYTVQADGSILLDWSDSQADEDYVDPLSGVVDFEGYRVYKSDRTDASGAILWLPLATYDIPGDGVGAESGLRYTYVDKDVNKGFAYNYAVTAFDDGLTPIGVLESSKGAAVSSARIEYNAPPAANLDNIAVVPNPYLGSEIWDHRPSFQEQWWSKLQFINLPEEECTVRIYTLTGDFVIEITKDAGPSFVNWDLISGNDADIVSGVYLFVVEDANDSAVGKFVVIR